MTQASRHHRARSGLFAVAMLALVGALPLGFVAISRNRFGHASPLDGVNAPWRWTLADLRSWIGKLTRGLDSSRALIDLFFRAAVVAGWICFAVLVVTVLDEVVFQLRHGMPSARHCHLAGLGPLGRKLATSLVALLPMSMAAHPALGGPPPVHRHATITAPFAAAVPVSVPPAANASSWRRVEVQRGDSVWSIAERIAEGRDVDAVAEQIVTANLGSEMVDGRTFATPALIEPGWVLAVPARGGVPQDLVPPPVGDYVVERGDSYWKIAEDHLDPSATGSEIATYTRQLMSINAPRLGYRDERLIRPGDVLELGTGVAESAAAETALPVPAHDPPVLPPTSAPATTAVPPPPSMPAAPAAVPGATSTLPVDPVPVPPTEVLSHDRLPAGAGLAAAATLAASVLAALAVRRRSQLRSAEVGTRLSPAPPPLIDMERKLRAIGTADRAVRVDVALRAVASSLGQQASGVLAVEVDEFGAIRLHPTRPAMPVAPWIDDGGAWVLPGDVTLAELADDARRCQQPCPAIVHIGDGERGQLFLDLEAIGVLDIDAPPAVASAALRAVAGSLAVSPFAASTHVVAVGLESDVCLGNPWSDVAPSLAEAIDVVGGLSAAIAVATRSASTFELRATAADGDAWEPSVLLCCGVEDVDELGGLADIAAGGGRGVAVVVDRPVLGSGATLQLADGEFWLRPLDIRVRPIGVSADEIASIHELLAAPEAPLQLESVHVAVPTSHGFIQRRHQFVVRVLGQVEVTSAEGVPARFERSKALELVVWLTQHRHRPTRGSARAALWETSVRDATFSNVVSEARRALAKVVPPPNGQEWIGRTLNDDLPLHDLVVSDVELLIDRLEASRGLPLDEAIEVLRPAVALIEGMPFAGTSYLWPDAEGIASAAVLSATSAAAMLAELYLDIGNVEGVFWATGQGLKVLAGHEELIALRMRAHASRGDLAGVRSEWESYERALQADSWAAAEPSPKLVDLRRHLLAPSFSV
jgi:hypothetical protein